ncbi:MAG TPA: hypothetical protein DDZ51_09400, partial [Planctomycetaceae bacterium]|nr:hypothetical protein [Planctomycetaceae bacterium]
LSRFSREKTAIDELRSRLNNKSICSTTKLFPDCGGPAVSVGWLHGVLEVDNSAQPVVGRQLRKSD